MKQSEIKPLKNGIRMNKKDDIECLRCNECKEEVFDCFICNTEFEKNTKIVCMTNKIHFCSFECFFHYTIKDVIESEVV